MGAGGTRETGEHVLEFEESATASKEAPCFAEEAPCIAWGQKSATFPDSPPSYFRLVSHLSLPWIATPAGRA